MAVRPRPLPRRPAGAVSTAEACQLSGITRMTLWRWIYEDGLRYWRDPVHPHGYYYRPADLQAMKLRRGSRKIIRPKLPEHLYDYG